MLRNNIEIEKKTKYKKIFISFFVIAIAFIYLKNDGIYIVTKMTASPIEMLRQYSEIDFSDNIIVESFTIEPDEKSFFWNHNEYIIATILIPNDEINGLFPEDLIEYNENEALNLSPNVADEEFNYGVWLPRMVVKWFSKTQRTAYMTVMKSVNEYTRVYVVVDKLGWNKPINHRFLHRCVHYVD